MPTRAAPSTLPWWLLWVAFVVYGSLVPWDFKPVPMDQAISQFMRISLLQVGAEGRADWVANGVLYVPVGFLTAMLLRGRSTSAWVALLAGAAALVFSVGLAVAIEFVQLYFPPRTVSLNDLLAECIGAALGVGLAWLGGSAFVRLLSALAHNPRLSGGLLLLAYALVYLAFSLFPFDVLVSWQELADKYSSRSWGWLVAGRTADESAIAFASKLPAEVLMAVPLGFLLGLQRRSAWPVSLVKAFAFGVFLGIALEAMQFFIVSGTSQGLSAITRAVGVCAGAALWNRRQHLEGPAIQKVLRILSVPLVLVYLPLLLVLGGWFSSPWHNLNGALARLDQEVHFTPFYYHYFTTEAKAVFSLAAVTLMYAPVGVLVWAFRLQARYAAVAALLLALLVEAGKLFAKAVHPDPTNLLIAAAASFVVAKALQLLAVEMPQEGLEARPEPGAQLGHSTRADSGGSGTGSGTAYVLGALVLALGVAWLVGFPTQRLLLGAGLVAYTLITWYRPMVLFAAIPAAVPLLDLAPWSGRFFLDELDWLILISLAVGTIRFPQTTGRLPRKLLLWGLAALLALSFGASTVRALLPWQMPDLNAFNNYFSPFNGLRITKGVLWAILLLPLMQRASAAGRDVVAAFGTGMIAGLAGTVLFALWERLSFTELLNYSDQYRIAGPMSAMHNGGAYIECFLAVAAPFLLLRVLQTGSHWRRLLGGVLVLGTTYALMVTFSRNGYLAFAVAFAVLLLAAWRERGRRLTTTLIGLGLAGAAVALAVPIFQGTFVQSRVATVAQDYGIRQAHWADALALRDPGWPTLLLGSGVGRFPAARYWAIPENERTATYQLVGPSGNPALRLGVGQPIYIDQIIRLQPQQSYLLKLDIRPGGTDNTATVHLCHKWQLSSYDCRQETFRLENNRKWQHFERKIDSGVLGADPWYARRPVKLTLQNSSKSAVDFDNVRLLASDGSDLIANGSFTQRLDHWNFTSDNHLAWHIHALPVAVLFDQGLLGLMALGAVVLAACWRAARASWRGNLAAGAVLAALAAFLVLGAFDTLIDSPRFLMLFLLLCWLALLPWPKRTTLD